MPRLPDELARRLLRSRGVRALPSRPVGKLGVRLLRGVSRRPTLGAGRRPVAARPTARARRRATEPLWPGRPPVCDLPQPRRRPHRGRCHAAPGAPVDAPCVLGDDRSSRDRVVRLARPGVRAARAVAPRRLARPRRGRARALRRYRAAERGVTATYFFTAYPGRDGHRYDCTYDFGDRCRFGGSETSVADVVRTLARRGIRGRTARELQLRARRRTARGGEDGARAGDRPLGHVDATALPPLGHPHDAPHCRRTRASRPIRRSASIATSACVRAHRCRFACSTSSGTRRSTSSSCRSSSAIGALLREDALELGLELARKTLRSCSIVSPTSAASRRLSSIRTTSSSPTTSSSSQDVIAYGLERDALVRVGAASSTRGSARAKRGTPRMSIEIDAVRGPLDEEQLGWIAELYGVGRREVRVARLTSAISSSTTRSAGLRTSSSSTTDARLATAAASRSARDAATRPSSREDRGGRRRRRPPRAARRDGGTSRPRCSSRCIRSALEYGMDGLFGLAPPHVARVHVRAGCHEVRCATRLHYTLLTHARPSTRDEHVAEATAAAARPRCGAARRSLADAVASRLSRPGSHGRAAVGGGRGMPRPRAPVRDAGRFPAPTHGTGMWAAATLRGARDPRAGGLPRSRAARRARPSPAQIVAWRPRRAASAGPAPARGGRATRARARGADAPVPTVGRSGWRRSSRESLLAARLRQAPGGRARRALDRPTLRRAAR